jgi:hypothetical protein
MFLNFMLFQGADTFFRAVVSNMENVYLSRNPTAKTILELVRSHDGDNIFYDHFAFRTFGVSAGIRFSCSILVLLTVLLYVM